MPGFRPNLTLGLHDQKALPAVLLVVVTLLFVRIGNYALWDDEANTSFYARSLWQFGQLTAWDGANLAAYAEGFELTGLKNELIPPLQCIVAAPFVGLLGRSPFAARLPFVLTAAGGFVFIWYWLVRKGLDWRVQGLTWLLFIGNVSLLLYSRQARNYSLSWVLSLITVYAYLHRRESAHLRLVLVLGSVLLIYSHYFNYGAFMVCLGADYLLFQFRKKNDTWVERGIFLAAHLLGLGLLESVYHLSGRSSAIVSYVPVSWWADKLKLFWWNIRDLNTCEFFWSPMLLIALVAALWRKQKDILLLRAVLALVLYALGTALLSHQAVGWDPISPGMPRTSSDEFAERRGSVHPPKDRRRSSPRGARVQRAGACYGQSLH